ncbi:hypothetical protein GBA52_028045 [Prunus armeniaca]|nr:hypothetical protein GBA52_028045 [Prunus armeniaca]
MEGSVKYENNEDQLNFKATELRLGLPGSTEEPENKQAADLLLLGTTRGHHPIQRRRSVGTNSWVASSEIL